MGAERGPVNGRNEFYQAGGCLRLEAPSYAERRADEELFTALRAGEFCYALTARQVGKSSLRARTAARLRAAGVRTAELDLTTLGQELNREQWYYGLLKSLGDEL